MSIDLKGNTNYVALKNLQDQVVVPRTNLAAECCERPYR